MNLDLVCIKEVIRLSELCAIAESRTPDRISLAEYENYLRNPAVQEARSRTRDLEMYMESLNYATILDLESLMQIGRDGDYSEADPYEVRFQSCRDYFARTYPDPAGKNLAIDYLAGKVDLARYLKDGLNAVGIKI